VTRIAVQYRRTVRWLVANRLRLRSGALAVVVFIAAVLFTQWWDFTIPGLGRAHYQAIFMTNGQTYFGRFYDRIGAYAKIEDVYYLQSQTTGDGTSGADTRLVRRGRELHAPETRMLIPKSAILFVEDLTDASPIAQFMQRDVR
jgi:hypothetical protein